MKRAPAREADAAASIGEQLRTAFATVATLPASIAGLLAKLDEQEAHASAIIARHDGEIQ